MARSPIRVGLIGLTAHPNIYDWAGTVHLPIIQTSPHYILTALCNTSLPAAQAAAAKHNLETSSLTLHTSPASLAADPTVDLVVVVLRTRLHKDAALPSLLAGKNVFVEWPLGRTLAEAEEMAAAARQGGGRVMVGLQARQAPIFEAVKELVLSGVIGNVLSTNVAGVLPTGGGLEDKSLEFALDSESGSTILDVHFAHFMEGFRMALGELSSLSATVATQRPTTRVIDQKSGVITEDVPKSAPDQILVHGRLESGAVASIHLRGGASIEKGFRWSIYGKTGEIQITGFAAILNINVPGMKWNLKVADGQGNVTRECEIDGGLEEGKEWCKQPNVHRLYEAFAEGNTDGYIDFDGAVERQRLVSLVKESSRKGVVMNVPAKPGVRYA